MRPPLHLAALTSLLLFSCIVAAENPPLCFGGTVTDTTNPHAPKRAPLGLRLTDQSCAVVLGEPMYGSGPCQLQSLDEETGEVQLTSRGPLVVTKWTGTLAGTKFSGRYADSYPELPDLPGSGEFALEVADCSTIETLADIMGVVPLEEREGKKTVLLRERNFISIHDAADGKYLGRRGFLNKDGELEVLIEDSQDSSVATRVSDGQVLVEWYREGDSGYYVRPVGQERVFLDRFLQPTGWSSLGSGDSLVYLRRTGTRVDVFDKERRPTGMWSDKTPQGRVYWARSRDGVTEFLDESFKPLNWYAFEKGGQTLYARQDSGGQLRIYDSAMRELRQEQPRQKKTGFWGKLGKGLLIGLAAYGEAQAQQEAAARAAREEETRQNSFNSTSRLGLNQTRTVQRTGGTDYTHVSGDGGYSATTSTQRLGSTSYSHSTDNRGNSASWTTQRLGSMDFTSGYSSAGSFSGTAQHLGSTTFSNLTSPSGQWRGTSQRLGNFTFHSFTGPDGRMLNGTTTQIGDFAFTTVR